MRNVQNQVQDVQNQMQDVQNGLPLVQKEMQVVGVKMHQGLTHVVEELQFSMATMVNSIMDDPILTFRGAF
jgi:peptidoglycan hydrolase CwlO-like protein